MNHPEITNMRRAVALGKATALEREAYRLGVLVSNGMLAHLDAVDALHEAALANGLDLVLGDEMITAIVGDGVQCARADHREAA